MANFIGGEITEITCNHSLGTFRFTPKQEEDFTIDFGGIRNEVMATADGRTIQKKTRKPWMIEGNVTVDLDSEQVESYNQLSESSEEGVWTINHISGAIYSGTGVPAEDISFTTAEAQLKLKASGGGRLSRTNG